MTSVTLLIRVWRFCLYKGLFVLISLYRNKTRKIKHEISYFRKL
ncbi:hypothetical protein VP424E501_P0139 [Vibrio phage 424E50-1]|nr:hypothetical protein VP424E501_P0139 [Vibrio phage 424E50-1]